MTMSSHVALIQKLLLLVGHPNTWDARDQILDVVHVWMKEQEGPTPQIKGGVRPPLLLTVLLRQTNDSLPWTFRALELDVSVVAFSPLDALHRGLCACQIKLRQVLLEGLDMDTLRAPQELWDEAAAFWAPYGGVLRIPIEWPHS